MDGASKPNTWTAHVQPIVARCEIAAKFQSRVCFNSDGADALGKLLKEMAHKLDYAMDFVDFNP